MQLHTEKTTVSSPASIRTVCRATLLGISCLLALTVNTSFAMTPVRGDTASAKKGFEIAARSDRSDRGYRDSAVELTMTLENAAGQQASRKLTITTLEMPDESVGDKSLVLFTTPRDIAGTALLSHAQILEADNQWLFLPALKRVKRISSRNKSGPFVGSEFAFEDFTAQELNKFDYNWIKEEACGDLICDVLERTPRYEHSGYTKQIAWIDQTDHQVRRVDFYDRANAHLKTLTLSDYRSYALKNNVKAWRAHTMTMVNHVNNKKTTMNYSDFKFETGLSESDFVKSRLSRLQ